MVAQKRVAIQATGRLAKHLKATLTRQLPTKESAANKTRPSLDADLVERVREKLGDVRTAKDTVEDALRIVLHVPRKWHIFGLSGQIDYEPGYPEKARGKRSTRVHNPDKKPGIVELFGKVDFRDDWDYKAERGKRDKR